MQTNQLIIHFSVMAMDEDGFVYKIETRSRSLPGDDPSQVYFYCCLSSGEKVMSLRRGHYELPDGTVVRTVVSNLPFNQGGV